LSFATVAEVISFAIRLEWGKTGKEAIQSIINSLTIIHSSQDLTNHYVDIASFSQGIHDTLRLPKGISARNMGENDIWIAATTKSIEGAELITTDRDFEHLDGVWFEVNYVEVV
ncbi:MAG: PIN domain-containing protein, partial [Chitinophagales bacterium]